MNALQALTLYTGPAIRQQIPSIWSYSYSVAQGPDAQQSDGMARRAVAHWSERPTVVLMIAESDDFSYQHVPLLPSRTVKTRYRYVGRLAPREYPLDE